MLDAISSETAVKICDIIDQWSAVDVQKTLQKVMELKLVAPAPSDLKDFTKAAMQGLCSNSVFNSPVGADQTPEGVVAQIAVSIARATLSELQKQQS